LNGPPKQGGVSWSSYWATQISAYAARVAADGGTVYNGSDGGLTYLTGRSDMLTKAYYDEALLVMVPSAVKAGTLYSVKGTDFGFARNLQKWVVNASNILYSSAVNVPALRWDGGRARWEFDKENSAVTLATNSLNHESFLAGGAFNLTKSANTDNSPFGANTADRGTETSATGSHTTYGGATRSSGSTYTISFVIRAVGRTAIAITLSDNTSSTYIYDFTGTTATRIAGIGSCGIESYGDGYFRIWAVKTMEGDTLNTTNNIYLALYNGSTSYAGNTDCYYVRAMHQIELGSLSSPIISAATNLTRPEDVATATAVIDTDNPYTFVYSLSGQTYIEVYKDGNKSTYIDGILNGTVVQAASADITLSAVGRYGHFIAFGRELTESEMVFF